MISSVAMTKLIRELTVACAPDWEIQRAIKHSISVLNLEKAARICELSAHSTDIYKLFDKYLPDFRDQDGVI